MFLSMFLLLILKLEKNAYPICSSFLRLYLFLSLQPYADITVSFMHLDIYYLFIRLKVLAYQ